MNKKQLERVTAKASEIRKRIKCEQPAVPEGVEADEIDALKDLRDRAWKQAEHHSRGNEDNAATRCRTQFNALGKAIAALSTPQPAAQESAQGEDASCPFCGSKARRDDGYGGYISCSNITDDSGGCFMALDWFDASKWNRRAALTTHAPVVELPWPTISNAQLLKYTETRKGRLDGTLAQALLDTRAALARTQENG